MTGGLRPCRPLTSAEACTIAWPVLKRVAPGTVWNAPFAPHVEARAILFPVGFGLDIPQLKLIAEAGRAVGDDAMFLSMAERFESDGDPQDWWIPFDNLACAEDPTVEASYYGESGRWAYLTSHEDHAVVGGPAEFVEIVLERFPSPESPTQHYAMPESAPNAALPVDAPLEARLEAIISRAIPFELPTRVDPRRQVEAFLEYWKGLREKNGLPYEFIPLLIRHVHGDLAGQRLLCEHAW